MIERFSDGLEALFRFGPRPRIVLGLSGGPDSMALLLLLGEWAKRRGGGEIIAATVDHGLRPESRSEAETVASRAKSRGFEHGILTWEGEKPASGIQEAAREARYRLLLDFCRQRGAAYLMTAHTADDQAETVAMRFFKGSGLAGLAGIPALSFRREAALIRPLLGFRKRELRDFLEAQGAPYVEDPSNADPKYERARLRQRNLPALELCRSAARLSFVRDFLAKETLGFLIRHAELHPLGFIRLSRAGLEEDKTLVLQALKRILRTVSGALYPPRGEKTEALYGRLLQNKGSTSYGCCIVPKADHFLIAREPAALPPPVSGTAGRWDRFSFSGVSPEETVGALTDEAFFKADGLSCPFPALVRRTLPAVYRGGRLAACPALRFGLPSCKFQFDPPIPLAEN